MQPQANATVHRSRPSVRGRREAAARHPWAWQAVWSGSASDLAVPEGGADLAGDRDRGFLRGSGRARHEGEAVDQRLEDTQTCGDASRSQSLDIRGAIIPQRIESCRVDEGGSDP